MLAFVIILTLILLARAFRSVVLALKAALLNLISLAAAYGIIVFIFQKGHGSETIWGIHATQSIIPWIPLMIFAFLFGLSMDYEVFLLTRMREIYDETGDTDTAIRVGLARTGKLVTSAALVLMFAFFTLSLSPGLDIKQFAIGLAAGIIFDATVIRVVLVPSLMKILGVWNWWLPAPAAKVLLVREPGPPGAGARLRLASLDSAGCAGSAGSCPRAGAWTGSGLPRCPRRSSTAGPTPTGRSSKGGAGLAARRLAIIDLESGDQPISNEDGSCTVVQNGEIYNYAELRRELERAGHRMATHSDTETIVHAYEQWGLGFAARLRGMFAVAIWDERRKRLVLARDRFGIKPLYYRVADGELSFASELDALPKGDLDLDALEAFLATNCVPGPLSIFREIRKLPPGHVLTWSEGVVVGGAVRPAGAAAGAERRSRPSSSRSAARGCGTR